MNLKPDLSREWLALKGSGAVNLKIDQSRLPYIAQTMGAAIDDMMLVASVKSNPATFTVDGAPANLARVDDWKLCRGGTSDIAMGTPSRSRSRPLS